MATATLPTKCIGCGTRLNRSNRASVVDRALGVDDTCTDCYTTWGLENDHSDNGHDLPVAGCPTCRAEIAELAQESPHTTDLAEFDASPVVPVDPDCPPGEEMPGVVYSAGTGRRYIDHSNHPHPCTPKARAACRAQLAAGGSAPVPPPVYTVRSGSARTVHLGVGDDHTATVCTGRTVRNADVSTQDILPVTCVNCLRTMDDDPSCEGM